MKKVPEWNKKRVREFVNRWRKRSIHSLKEQFTSGIMKQNLKYRNVSQEAYDALCEDLHRREQEEVAKSVRRSVDAVNAL